MPERIVSHKKSTNVRLFAVRVLARTLAALSPDLTARIVEWLFLRTRRHAIPSRERKWMQGAVETKVKSGLHSLSAWSWGQGPVVLLAHGWEGRGSQMGAFIEPLLAAGFRVVTFDAPGHGRSTGKSSSLVEMADAVADVGRHFGPLFGLVAHSAGAAVSTMAMADGLRVEQAVFLAPPSDPGNFLYAMTDLLGLDRGIPRRTQRRIEDRFDIRWDDLRATALAPGMRTPLLILHDRDDRQVPVEQAAEIAGVWPGSRVITTAGLGHQRPLRDPGVVTTVVQHLRQARAAERLPGTQTA